MKMQEKLQHFYKVSLESAQEEAQKEIESYEKELEDGFASYKEDRLRQEETNRKTEQESARRQINKEISSEQIELRRRLSVCRDECKQQLFQEVEQKLKDYRKDPSYEEYLFGKYKKALVAMGMPMSVLKSENIFEKIIAVKYDVPNDKLEMFDDYHRSIDEFYENVLRKNG